MSRRKEAKRTEGGNIQASYMMIHILLNSDRVLFLAFLFESIALFGFVGVVLRESFVVFQAR